MSPTELRALLEQVRAGALATDTAAKRLAESSNADLGYATLDLQRKDRCGFPEVVFAEGKAAEWVEGAIRRLSEAGQDCFVTRLNESQADHLASRYPQAQQDRLARTFWLPSTGERAAPVGRVCIVTAGTSDLPVAQEALVTARVMGVNVELVADVGVAGIHRVLRQRDKLTAADAVVVVAGMDGALPSVVGGLVDCPVIACPTSVGYGASFGGVAALLTMLNSCSAGVTVVNIDAGFKAGYAAALIARRVEKGRARG
jgi:pyridinium-3,5-biscarboxylic acid mononucleotide synthase